MYPKQKLTKSLGCSLKTSIKALFPLLSIVWFFLGATAIKAQPPTIFDCGVEGVDPNDSNEPRESSNCNLVNESVLCVRIKFHFLNNTTDPINAPSDAFYFDLLEKINEAYAPGKIKFTFDYNCIHRETLSQELSDIINDPLDVPNNHSTVIKLAGQSISPIYNYAYQEEFEEDPNSINIYSIQKQIPIAEGSTRARFFAHYFKRAIVPLNTDSLGVLIHEIGHTLGLRHTFGSAGGFNPEQIPDHTLNYRLCKNPTEIFPGTTNLKCLAAHDFICDTGLDPWVLDLGPQADGKVDHHKWVDPLTCTQKPELLDDWDWECDDDDYDWEVPAKNYMSYYRTCRSEFTTGQFCYIHEVFPQAAAGYAKIVNCSNEPYANIIPCIAPDIIINSIVPPWENQTIYLCPGQKIIIEGSGALTIDNCTITKIDQISPNAGCPDLIYDQFWDGIYLENIGLSAPSSRLIINNSRIEYSKNGIQSTDYLSGILIKGTTFENNLTQMNIKSPIPLKYKIVRIINSNFHVAPSSLSIIPLSPVQISVVGIMLWIQGSKLINPNFESEIKLTGVRSSFGQLRIENASYIDNFYTAIDKAGDSGSLGHRGCFIYGNEIRNCENSILNTCKSFNAFGNILEGNIYSEGLGYSQWKRNYILADKVILQSPKLSCRIENNLFENATMEFYGSNKLSYASCNTWENTNENTAFVGLEGVTLPPSWGGGSQLISSGNRKINQISPYMIAQDHLKNYYFPSYPNEIFSYDPILSLLTGSEATSIWPCAYNYPINPPVPVEDPQLPQIDYTAENTKWDSLYNKKSEKEAELIYASEPEATKLKEDINYINFQMADIVGTVLLSLSASDTLLAAEWDGRADDEFWFFSDLADLFFNEEFTQVKNMIESTNNDDAQTLLLALDYLERICSVTKHINQLTLDELDSLTLIASLTFGDYTNVIRDLLRVYYNIDISWPVDNFITPRSPNSNSIKKKDFNEFKISLHPNPTNECFEIIKDDPSSQYFILNFYDLHGRLLMSRLLKNNEQVCLKKFDKGMYIATIRHQFSTRLESFRLVLN